MEMVGHGCFRRTFGDRVVLVPVPRSDPANRAPWPGERLAWCLNEIGLAAGVWPVLRRRYAVRKSAFAPIGERPSVLEHYDSFAIARGSWSRTPIQSGDVGHGCDWVRLQLTLVDDVITRGRTLLAAAAKLHEAFPAAQIRAFTLLRTLGRDEMLQRVLEPCEGEVRWAFGDARRCP